MADRRSKGDWVRQYYNVPAKARMRVNVDGRPGVITGFRGGRLLVRFDGEKRPVPAHPTWRVEYLVGGQAA